MDQQCSSVTTSSPQQQVFDIPALKSCIFSYLRKLTKEDIEKAIDFVWKLYKERFCLNIIENHESSLLPSRYRSSLNDIHDAIYNRLYHSEEQGEREGHQDKVLSVYKLLRRDGIDLEDFIENHRQDDWDEYLNSCDWIQLIGARIVSEEEYEESTTFMDEEERAIWESEQHVFHIENQYIEFDWLDYRNHVVQMINEGTRLLRYLNDKLDGKSTIKRKEKVKVKVKEKAEEKKAAVDEKTLQQTDESTNEEEEKVVVTRLTLSDGRIFGKAKLPDEDGDILIYDLTTRESVGIWNSVTRKIEFFCEEEDHEEDEEDDTDGK